MPLPNFDRYCGERRIASIHMPLFIITPLDIGRFSLLEHVHGRETQGFARTSTLHLVHGHHAMSQGAILPEARRLKGEQSPCNGARQAKRSVAKGGRGRKHYHLRGRKRRASRRAQGGNGVVETRVLFFAYAVT